MAFLRFSRKQLLHLGLLLSTCAWSTTDLDRQPICLSESCKTALSQILTPESMSELMEKIEAYNNYLSRKQIYEKVTPNIDTAVDFTEQLKESFYSWHEDTIKKIVPQDLPTDLTTQMQALLSNIQSTVSSTVDQFYKNLIAQRPSHPSSPDTKFHPAFRSDLNRSAFMSDYLQRYMDEVSDFYPSSMADSACDQLVEYFSLNNTAPTPVVTCKLITFEKLLKTLKTPPHIDIDSDPEKLLEVGPLSANYGKDFSNIDKYKDYFDIASNQNVFMTAFRKVCNQVSFLHNGIASPELKDLIIKMVADFAWCWPIRQLLTLWMAQLNSPLSDIEILSTILRHKEGDLYVDFDLKRRPFTIQTGPFSMYSNSTLTLTVDKLFKHSTYNGEEIVVGLLAQFLHEGGHYVDRSSYFIESLETANDPFVIGTLNTVAAHLQTLSVDPQQLNSLSQQIKQAFDWVASENYDDFSTQDPPLDDGQSQFQHPALQKLAQGKELTPAETAQLSFQNISEFSNIVGLSLIGNTLYINPLSNWAIQLCCTPSPFTFPELIRPMPPLTPISSHLGFPADPALKLFTAFSFKPNPAVNTLLNFFAEYFGSDIRQNKNELRQAPELAKHHVWNPNPDTGAGS